MLHIGDVTLPDGRTVHGRVVADYEFDTNATNIINSDLTWPDGTPLTADEYNERIGNEYLQDYVIDRVLMCAPEAEDWF